MWSKMSSGTPGLCDRKVTVSNPMTKGVRPLHVGPLNQALKPQFLQEVSHLAFSIVNHLE